MGQAYVCPSYIILSHGQAENCLSVFLVLIRSRNASPRLHFFCPTVSPFRRQGRLRRLLLTSSGTSHRSTVAFIRVGFTPSEDAGFVLKSSILLCAHLASLETIWRSVPRQTFASLPTTASRFNYSPGSDQLQSWWRSDSAIAGCKNLSSL